VWKILHFSTSSADSKPCRAVRS